MDSECIAGTAAGISKIQNRVETKVRPSRWLIVVQLILALIFVSGLHLEPKNGRIALTVSEAHADTIQYIYDDLGRLVEAVNTTSGQSVQYTYDAVGNITSQVSVSLTTLSISNFSPQQGPSGATVTISGTGFSATPSNNSVTFNGTSASVQSATQTQIVATVPAGATTGVVSVTVGASTATTTVPFTVTATSQGPIITNLLPVAGNIGSPVTIVGTGFDPSPANDNVVFGSAFAIAGQVSPTSVLTQVPAIAGSGKVQLITPAGIAMSPMDFIVLPAGYTLASMGGSGRVPTDGSTTNLSLPTPSKINVELFDASAGDLLTIGVTSFSLTSATLKVYEPHGALLGSGAVTTVGQGLQLPKLPRSGTYTIVVDPGTHTGLIGLSVTRPLPGILTVNAAATPITLSPPGRRAALTFAGTQGMYASVSLSSVTLSAGVLSVIAPNGAVLDSSSFTTTGKVLQPQLPVNGTYTVLIDPSGSIGGSFNVAVSSSSTPALGVGTELTVGLPTTSAVNVSFEGTAGQFLSLGISENQPSPVAGLTYTILAPDGSQLATGVFTGQACAPNCAGSGPYIGDMALSLGVLPQGGTYTIVLTRSGTTAGSVILSLSTPVTASMTMNSSSFLTVPQAGQAMLFTVPASAGQYVSVAASEGANSIPAAIVTVYGPDGSVLGSSNFNTNCAHLPSQGNCSGTSQLNLPQLSQSGNLSILVQQTGAGNGYMGVVVSVPVVQPVSFGTIVGVPVLLGQGVAMTFQGAQGQYVASLVSEGSGVIPGANLSVLNPDGSTLATGTYAPSTCVSGPAPCYQGGGVVNVGPLAVAGTYTFLVQQTTGAQGTLFVGASLPVTTTMTPGTQAPVFTSTTGQPIAITFAGAVGQYFTLGISEAHAAIPGANVTIVAPDGSTVTTGTFAPTGSGGSYSGTAVVNIGPLKIAGNYTALVQQTSGIDDTGGVTFVLSSPLADTLTPGTPTTEAVSLIGQSMQLSFAGSAGGFYSLAVASINGTIPAATVSILKPDGTTLSQAALTTTVSNGKYTGSVLLNAGPLPTSGTYTALIQQTTANIGTLAVTLTNPSVAAISPGVPASIPASLSGQAMAATFSGTAGTSVSMHVQENYGSYIPSAKISVLNPDGSPLTSGTLTAATCGGCDGYAGATDVFPQTLTQTGTYTLIAQQVTASTGSLTVSGNGIQAFTSVTTPLSTSTAGQTATYSFTAAAGQDISVGVSNFTITPTVSAWAYLYIYKPDGTLLNQTNCTLLPSYPGCTLSYMSLPQSGVYTVKLVPPGAQTMSFNLGISQDAGGVLPPSTTATSVSLSTIGESALYSFTATAGQTFALNVGSITTVPANQTVTATVYNSAGAVVGSASSPSNLTVNLLNLPAGTYQVIITPSNGASANIQVTLAPGLAGVLSAGSAVTETASVPGQIGNFTFAGTIGQSVSVGLANLSITPSVLWTYLYVYNPDGTTAGSINCGPSPTYAGCNVSLPSLTQNGTYTVRVIPAGQQTISFTLGFSQDTGGVLPPSTTPTALSLPIVGENGLYSFTATAGQTLAFYAGSISTTPAGQNVTATVYNSAGAVVGTAGGTTALTVNLLSLAADAYRVVVVPSNGAIASMQVTLAPGLAGELTDGAAAAETASVPGQMGNFTFTATAGENVSVGVTNLTITPLVLWPYLYVYNPDGTSLGSINCGPSPSYTGCNLSLRNLPQSGVYIVRMIPPGEQTMSFTLGFSQDTGGALSPSTTPTSLSLPIVGENGLYTFTASAGQVLALYVSSISTTPASQPVTATVYNSAGTAVGSATSAGSATNLTVNLIGLAADTYQVLITPTNGAIASMQVTLAPGLTGTLVDGASVNEVANVPGQIGSFSFAAVAGANVAVGLDNMTITPSVLWPYLYVYYPDGTLVGDINCGPTPSYPGCNLSMRNLAQTGIYTVRVIPAGEQLLTYTLGFSQDTGGALPIGTTATNLSLPTVGENALYTFSATSGQTLAFYVGSITTSPANQIVTATVYNSAGTAVGSATGTSGLTVNLNNLAAGTYSAVIVPANGATATMQVTLAPGLVGVLTDGTAATEAASVPGQNGYFTFAATAGENIAVGLTNLVMTPTAFWTYMYVYNPDGSQLGNINCGPTPSYLGCTLSFRNLAQTGNYRLLVIPPGQQTLSYTLGFSQDAGGALPAGTSPTNLSLPTVGENAFYTFTATAGQSFALYVNSISTSPVNQTVTATVYNSAGTAVAINSGASNFTINLIGLAAGNYQVLIAPANGATATMQVTLAPGLTATLPLDGTTTNIASNVPGQQVGNLSFSATAGQTVSIALNGITLTPTSTGWNYLYVYKPDGTALTNINCGSLPTYPGCEFVLMNLPQTGAYTARVVPPGQQQMSLTADVSANQIAALTLGTTQAVNLAQMGQSETLTFTATASETVALAISSVSTTPANTVMIIHVYNSAGTQVGSGSTSTATTINMPSLAAGTYQVLISPTYPATSSMQVVYH